MCYNNTNNYSSFENFINSLDNHNELKKYIYSNRSTSSDFEKNVFVGQLKDAFCKYTEDKNDKNRKWFENKLEYIKNFNDIQNDDKARNYISIIGELQVYGLLMRSLFGFGLEHRKEEKNINTPDFIYIDDDNKVNIEIAILLGTNKKEKLITNYADSYIGIHPFSKPQKADENDLSGLISMLNNIKQKDEQFNKKDINILFINLVSPIYKNLSFNFFEERYKPYYIIKCPYNTIYSGGLWQAFYSKKNDNIFHSIGVMDNIDQEVYKMPYNSRFNKSPDEKYSIADFAIINTYETTAIYQNLNRKQKIHKNIYRCLMSLNNIKLDSLWINFPINNLEKRVNYHRRLGKAYLREAKKDRFYV